MKNFSARKTNQSGFIVADFLFSFVLVIGIGIFIFALTFSLATIEISQYLVWSSARTYASGNTDEPAAAAASAKKFQNLSAQFPLLTGVDESSPWFVLDDFTAQDHATQSNFKNRVSDADSLNKDGNAERRQPWTGASATLYLKLFSSLKIPFLGKLSKDPDDFKFRVYGFIIRSPSTKECRGFYNDRFRLGIQSLEGFSSVGSSSAYASPEDNGC